VLVTLPMRSYISSQVSISRDEDELSQSRKEKERREYMGIQKQGSRQPPKRIRLHMYYFNTKLRKQDQKKDVGKESAILYIDQP
jgi:hypothetical protein